MHTDRRSGPQVLSANCTGPNPACRAAYRAGRTVHVIPARSRFVIEGTAPNDRARMIDPILVLPTYHFRTAEEGVEFIRLAAVHAPTVATDDDLYAYRALNMPHYLPVGWIDPTRRTGS